MSDTIKYDLPVKDLIAGLDATGHVTHVPYNKDMVTLHHNGGRLSHEGVLRVWQTRPASAHFDVDTYGDLAQYVRLQEYAWAVGNKEGNQRSISIEMCNATLSPNWVVGQNTWEAAARLAGWLHAKSLVGKPQPSRSTLVYHHYWKPTDCAGPYMDSIYNKVLEKAQSWYAFFSKTPPPPAMNLTIATKAVVTGLGGLPMNLVDSYFADCRQVLAWGAALPHQPVNPVTRDAWVYHIKEKNFARAGEIFRAAVTNLQDYFGIPEDMDHLVEMLLRMKPYGYQIISYAGTPL